MRAQILALAALLCCTTAAAVTAPGALPPDNLGHTPAGDAVTVPSLRGKVVVISFWATWCGYCMKELPILAGLQRIAGERHLGLQVVALDYRESRDVFHQAAKKLRTRLPDLLVTWDRTGSIRRQYDSGDGIPVMVMLHRDGRVAHVYVGYDESMLDELVTQINALLAEPVPPALAAPA